MNSSRATRREFLRTAAIAGLGIAGASCAPLSHKTASGHPNIVVILADDLGYGDVGCYGATKVKTPNIDRIAKEGILFTDAHSPVAVCTPTRYCFLTGEYAFRNKRKWNRNRLIIEPGRTTLPSLLKKAGYATGCVGKWHLGFGNADKVDWNRELNPGPLEIGFDYYFGTPMAHNEPPQVIIENHRILGLDPADPITLTEPGEGAYWGEMLGGASARYQEDQLTRVHTPKAVSFIEQHRKEPFFLYFATHNVHVPITPHPRFKGASQAGTYGDYLAELDWCVGEVLATLDRLGLADDTLIMFTSDNGAMLFPEVIGAGHKANGELLGQKTDVWEGGHRVPMLIRWPGKIQAGRRSDALACLLDVFATAASISGVPLADNEGVDSFDMLPHLLGQSPQIRESLFLWGTLGGAYREGDWLFIPYQGSGGHTTEYDTGGWLDTTDLRPSHSDYDAEGKLKSGTPAAQLYNMAKDPHQKVNLLRNYPEKAKELHDKMVALQVRLRSMNAGSPAPNAQASERSPIGRPVRSPQVRLRSMNAGR